MNVLLLVIAAVSAGSSTTSHWHGPCPVDDGYYQCADWSTCVAPRQQCDGRADCSDSSDETDRCRQTCSEDCSGSCQQTPLGPRCRPCSFGQRLDSRDNRTCIDVDECAYDPPMCSQLCNNSAPQFTCSCVAGYRLSDDLRHCVALPWKPGGPFLIYAQANGIYQVSVRHGTSALPSLVHRSRGHIFSLAVDSDEETVYFFDMDENVINSIGADGTNMKQFITTGLSLVYTMAVDWLANNIYIMDSELKRLVICSVSKSICTSTNIPSAGTFSSIALNPHSGKMYWSECGSVSSVQRIVEASMDGSNVRTLVADGVRCPTSLRIDLPLRRLYWTEHELNVIDSISVDGTNRRKIKSRYISHPTGLDVFEEEIYWANTVNYAEDTPINKILSANKFLANNSQPIEIVSKLHDVTSELHIFHAALQIQTTSACDQAHCSEVCLLNDQGGYTCACSAGKTLAYDKHRCTDTWDEPSLLVATKNHVLKLVPDAVGHRTYEVLAVIDGNITALAVDIPAKMLYFATASPPGVHGLSVSSGNIFRVSIEKPGTPSIVVSGVKTVTGIAVDWISRNLYWIDREKGTIEMAKLDGATPDKISRTTLHSSSSIRGSLMEDVRAIAVDPKQQRLYYSDCSRGFPHIGICNMAVDTCTTVPFSAPHGCVTSLTVDVTDQRVYWSDSERGVISSADVTGQQIRPIRHSLEPVSVAVFADRVFWTDLHFRDVLFHRKGDTHSRGKITVGLSPLTAIVAVDVKAQLPGDNTCTNSNGGCSHICVPITRSVVRCLCPSPLVLTSDRKTCTEVGRHEEQTRRAPIFITRPTTTRAYPPRRRPMNLPRELCTDGYCKNGGSCTMFTGRATCICPSGMSGARCENATSSMSQDVSSVSVGHVWIVGVIAALVVVTLAIIVLLMYYLRKKGYLSKPSMVQFKAVIFGSSSDNDEHKAKLVNPSYENPGYIDADDDDQFSEKRGRVRPSAPTVTRGDLASDGHNEYTYITKLDTADP